MHALDVPKPWKSPFALLVLIASVATGTVGVFAYAKALADERANYAVMPLISELKQHEARLERIEQKIDRLLEKR